MSKIDEMQQALKPATDENGSPVLQREYDRIKHLNARYADLLRQIAYPRFGTEEMDMDREDCANLIASNFSLAILMANV